jgi:phosphatidate cytidylyltransferase
MLGIPVTILILFLHVIITNMETTFKDVAYTMLGILYITGFIMFLSLIRGLEHGKIILGYTIIVAWATDIFAYLVGKRWGKHKFSKISPKKSIEGCIAGIVGAVVICLIYVTVVNVLNISTIEAENNTLWLSFANPAYMYIFIILVSIVLSVISQIGDFVASSIKRFVDTKDYSNLLPGHGGMLDRIDSLIFIAPFVYMIMILL